MRITKVKIDKKNVSIYRTSGGAKLIYNNNSDRDKTDEILQKKKTTNFCNSLVGKIIIKEDPKHKDSNECRKRKQSLKTLLGNALKGRFDQYSTFDTQKCIRPQYEEIKVDGKTYNLTELIHQRKLHIFKQWAFDNIDKRCEHLKKSIRNNKITLSDDPNPSKRKSVLMKFAVMCDDDFQLQIKDIEDVFQVETLITTLSNIDKSEFKNKTFDYHRKIKKVLQAHQAMIFGTSANPNKTNRDNNDLVVYSQEVVKYLHRYFPLKATGRINKEEEQEYYIKKIADGVVCQIKNGVTAYYISSGKQKTHQLDSNTNTERLLRIRAEEAFASNLFDSTTFAAHNINLIMGDVVEKDILDKQYFGSKINSANFEIFKLFFNCNKQEELSENNLWAMRGAVQQIRNKLTHYNQGNFHDIFNVETYEIKNYPSYTSYNSNLFFKSLLENEINGLNSKIAERLKSSGILEYYNLSILQILLERVEFPLCRSVVPFAPSYKKVFSRGCNIQKSKDNRAIKVDNFFNKTADESNEKYQARYNILKLIYENLFLNSFTKNESDFKKAVTTLLNKSRNVGDRAFAFAEIRDFNSAESIESYMAYLQSELHEEAIRKENNEEKRDRINFEKFILDLFVVGFDNYINQQNCAFIHKPKSLFDECNGASSDINIDAKTRANKLNELKDLVSEHIKLSNHNIDCQNSCHIAFYVYCKLLNSSYLGSLRNELLKYRSFTKDNFRFDYILSIIELCLLSSDIVNQRSTNYLKDITPFFKKDFKLEDCGELYYQSKECPVIHSGIELAKKYGTLDKLKKIDSENFHITEDDFKAWKEKKATMPKLAKERELLHEKWVERNKIDEQRYINICKEIDQYNWIDNKLHLIHINRLHNLMIDLLARMAGYVAKRDRDATYLGKYVKGNKELAQEIKKIIIVEPRDDNNQVIKKRNYIAHFMYLFNDEKSMLDMINDLRELMAYDRKFKNAVAKSIIKIFDKHQMELQLDFTEDTHQLIVKEVRPKKIYHLGSKAKSGNKEKIVTDSVHKDFCNMCKKLLEIKKNG